uniref:Radial spoke head protein 9 homolog n=1 Tax=Clastoptera arizonana TaxID=38151 RepID=A0A1B6DZ08_9HEMI
MDIYSLKSGIECLSNCGIILNTESYVLLRNSLVNLQNENHFKKTFLWGIIFGIDEDYYIAYGYEKDALKGKIFYYSLDRINWQLLPQPEPIHFVLTGICSNRFQGDPGLVTKIIDDSPVEESDEEGNGNKDEGTIKQDLDVLKEEDRLAATVCLIDEEVSIIPRGSLFLREDGITIHSLAFEGIKSEEWDELSNYQHYRVPHEKWNENIASRQDYNYAVDFLDTIASDIPPDSWAAQLVDAGRTIVVKSLSWPGFIFYHTLETRDYGFIYSGTGQKNLDIPFMKTVVTDDTD